MIAGEREIHGGLIVSLFGHGPEIAGLERSRSVDGLVHILKGDGSTDRKAAAAEALGRIGDDRAVSSLIAVLGHEEETVRAFSALALGRIGDSRAIKPLVLSLTDPHHRVRAAAAQALGEMREPRAARFLDLLLADPYEEVRHAAHEALDNISVDDVDLAPFESR